MSILDKKSSKQININLEDNLKTKLKYFGIKNRRKDRDVLSYNEKKAIKSLRRNKDIVFQRPDKGGGVVIMNRTTYESKLTELISDPNKFVECHANQTETVKKSINSIANKVKESLKSTYYKIRRIGDYNNGHLYGLPKIHKNTDDPPLRPIISMTGTVTHDVAQYINNIIRPYLNTTKIVTSGTELLVNVEDLKLEEGECLVSLDVEKLFTSVPVLDTIDIILESAYNHESLAPPKLPSSILKELLVLCTTKTPFNHGGKTYLQTDGVSMGSPLGPTFADFYMSHLEHKILSENRASNPRFYNRYVDDILAVFSRRSHVNLFKQRLTRSSVLNFTHEEMVNDTFNFLDVKLTLNNDKSFSTNVFIKPTDNGLYSDFNSYAPLSHKKSIIKSLIHRALKYTSSWTSFDAEINRIHQIFSNNNYPQALVEQIITRSVNKFHENNTDAPDTTNTIPIFVRLFSPTTFTQEKNELQEILKEHLSTTDPNKTIKLQPYFKPSKLGSKFSTRQQQSDPLMCSHVVYKYTCPKVGCNATYIGYTTCKLRKRAQQHRYKSSSIHKHHSTEHPDDPSIPQDFSADFTIIHRSDEISNLRTLEAIFIKEENPHINVKFNELSNHMNLFK